MSLFDFARHSNTLAQLLIGGVLGVCVSLPMASSSWAQSDAGHKRTSVSAKKKVAKSATQNRSPRIARASKAAPAIAGRPSYGQMAGLHAVNDPLDLRSSVALVIDQDTNEVLLRKNDQAVLPIASLTKLMTGLVIAEARLPMSELITITQDDVDTEKGSSSRLAVGSVLSHHL